MRAYQIPLYTLLLLLALAGPALAVDGVLEINQTCAISTGCFPGDSPGFPVSVTQPGSYRLTGNLDLSAEGVNVSGIAVSVPSPDWRNPTPAISGSATALSFPAPRASSCRRRTAAWG